VTEDYPMPVAKQRRRWPWILGVVLAFFLGIGAGASTVKPADQAWQPPSVATTTQHSDKITVTVSAETVTQEAAPVQPVGPATTMQSGTYQVGTDVVPGRYKTPGASYCYWARLKDDSGNFESIITNGSLNGPGSLTINVGEFIELSGDCIWMKVA